jgi:hypothetical protein
MVSAAVVATTMFAGVALAAPPNWVMTVTRLPAAVSPGAPAGYQVDIVNNGPSNISALYLVDKLDVTGVSTTPVYLTSSRPGTCNEGTISGPLMCAFGALNSGQSVTVVVAYDTPASGTTFPVEFQINTTGSTFSDVKGRSHGDQLTVVATTALSNNKNFGGFFSTLTDTGIGNSDQLSGNNKQSTRIGGIPPGLAGTVSDGSLLSGSCTTNVDQGIDCSLVDGETSVVTVGDGSDIPGGFFIVIHYKNGTTPTLFVHTYGPGLQEPIEQCASNAAPASLADYPCFTWDASITAATLYVIHNGTYTKLH